MTQDDIENGRLICLVGVAPIKASRVRDLPHRAGAGESGGGGGWIDGASCVFGPMRWINRNKRIIAAVGRLA
jgi:hypothetical protein